MNNTPYHYQELGTSKAIAIQDMFAALIKKHGLTMEGETVHPDLNLHPHRNVIHFDDEFMMYLIAGHVAGNVYDDMERGLWSLGIQIDDTDGCTMHFSTCKPIPLAAWEAIEDPENEDLMMLGQTIN